MNLSRISEESEHDCIVKEEFEFEEVIFTECEPILGKQQESPQQKISTKCGEVMLDYHGNFTLVCAMCEGCFNDLYTFGAHILKIHLKLPKGMATIVTKEEHDNQSQLRETGNITVSTSQSTTYIYADEEDYSEKQDDEVEIENEMGLCEGLTISNLRSISPWQQFQVNEDDNCDDDVEKTANQLEENIFRCSLCSRSYKTNQSLIRHTRKQHPNKTTDKTGLNSGNDSSKKQTLKISTKKIPFKLPEDMATIAPKPDHDDQSQLRQTVNVNASMSQSTADIYVDEDYSTNQDSEGEIENELELGEGLTVSSPRSISPWEEFQLDEADNSDDDVESTEKPLEENTFFCPICGRSYKTNRSFRAHIRQKHPDIIQDKNGSNPGKELPTELILKTPTKGICRFCNEQFNDTNDFRDHMATHTLPNRYSCFYCSKTFSQRQVLRLHQNTHEGVRPYKCSHCPKAFAHPTNLRNHERIHLKIFKYSCKFCDKHFIQSTEKVRHERTHTKELPFQCEECGQRFITLTVLTEHIRRHKNIRKYKCEYCQKSFFDNKSLRGHLPVHTKERPFSCNICGQTFPRNSSLRQHKLLHSNVKKYKCKVCGKNFAQFAGLYSHKKSHDEVA